jgi:glycosyltransferase involved in cell wall biosynthesis
MAKRKRVALIYAYNENWIGGTYYIENLIAALGQLPDSRKPELLIFSREATDAERLQQAIYYPYWTFRQFERTLSFPERVANKLTAVTLGRRFISPLYADIDIVFPLPTGWRHYFDRARHHLYWIPDFQEHYLPAFFKAEEIQERKVDQQLILQSARHIVFSSHAAQKDFRAIHPDSTLTEHILQFAVTSRPIPEQTAACLAQYDIAQPYFICSNQFWKHKNHSTVLRALAELRRTHPQALVVFTGKEHDYRNPNYFEELTALRNELGLNRQVRFLGFIPRADQLTLMQAAVSVIQPSLFEGWSTVVEDAKSLNVPLLASALLVHQEQLADYEAKLFFAPEAATELAHRMAQALEGELPVKPYAYQEDVSRFAQEFMNIVESITLA